MRLDDPALDTRILGLCEGYRRARREYLCWNVTSSFMIAFAASISAHRADAA